MTTKQSFSTNKMGANPAFNILFGVTFLLSFLFLSLIFKIAPLTVSHVLYKCSEAMSGISISLPHSFPSIFILALLLIVLVDLFLLALQIYKTRVFIARILKRKAPVPKGVKNVALELGLCKQVDIVSENEYFSFCYGLIFPRICLSLKLVNSLTLGELKAVLIHESYHLKNRDPLKILLSQVTVSMFFFTPALRDFHNHFKLSKELAADQLVVQTELVKELRTALAKSIGNITPTLNTFATFASDSNLEQRVNALTLSNFSNDINISIFRMVISILILGAAFGVLSLPVHAMENGDGTHSYFIMSPADTQMVSCIKESVSTEFPFSTEGAYSSINYSPMH